MTLQENILSLDDLSPEKNVVIQDNNYRVDSIEVRTLNVQRAVRPSQLEISFSLNAFSNSSETSVPNISKIGKLLDKMRRGAREVGL